MAVAFLILGGALCSLGVASEVHRGWTVVGGLLLLASLWLWRNGSAVHLLNTARALASAGERTQARALLDKAMAKHGWLAARNVELQRALIAWSEGDVESSIAHATLAIEGRGATWNARTWLDAAFGLRALASAVREELDAEVVAKDIATLSERRPLRPEPLAYAELARALVHYRGGTMTELRRHLASNCWLLFEHAGPRERALAHALWRGAYGRRSHVEAQPVEQPVGRSAGEGQPDAAEERPSPATEAARWARRLVPGLARYLVDSPSLAEAAPSTEAADRRAAQGGAGRPTPRATATPDRTTVEREKPVESDLADRARRRRSAVIRAVAATVAFGMLLVGSLMIARRPHPSDVDAAAPAQNEAVPSSAPGARDGSPLPGRLPEANEPSTRQTKTVFAIVGATLVLLGGWTATARSRQARLTSARMKLARGDLDGAESNLVPLCSASNPLLRVVAMLELARVAERRANFAAALSLSDKALSGLARSRLGVTDRLAADLQALRAQARLLLDEQGPGLDALPASTATRSSPGGKDTLLRARILEPARGGEWSLAHRVAVTQGCGECIDPRTIFLVDAVTALARRDREQASELKRLLADWDAGAHWMECAAPRLHTALVR